jgi:hypothetical protein
MLAKKAILAYLRPMLLEVCVNARFFSKVD